MSEHRVTTRHHPLQIEGDFGGVPFYFRARHDSWEIGVGPDPVNDPLWHHGEAYQDAGVMLLAIAEEIIERMAVEYDKAMLRNDLYSEL